MLKKPQANALWAELLAKSGKQWLPVLTGSMSPLIRPGDRVLVAKTDAGSISTGDIVAFRYGENIVVHRILKRLNTHGDPCFKEKGDATYYSKLIPADKVIGRVTALKKGDKTYFFNSPGSRLVTIILGFWLFITTDIISIFRSSTHKTIRRTGKCLSHLFLLISNLLVRVSSVVWFLYGLSDRRNVNAEQKQALPQAN